MYIIKGKIENGHIPEAKETYQMYVGSIMKLKSGEYCVYYNCNKSQAKTWKTEKSALAALDKVRNADEKYGGFAGAEIINIGEAPHDSGANRH